MADDEVDRLWARSLPRLKARGWVSALEDLSFQSVEKPDAAQAALVIGALQQKFGLLDDAATTLVLAAVCPRPDIAIQARSNLAKIESQRGRQDRAVHLLEDLRTSVVRDKLPVSSFWRLGFSQRMTGDADSARRSFAEHREISVAEHPSQMANNLTFELAADLIYASHGPSDIRRILAQAYHLYLQGNIIAGSASSVRYVSVTKSAVVPLALAGAAFLMEGQLRSALTQLLLVRRLMLEEQLTPSSEGIAELYEVLDRLPLGPFVRAMIGSGYMSLTDHRRQLTSLFPDLVVYPGPPETRTPYRRVARPGTADPWTRSNATYSSSPTLGS